MKHELEGLLLQHAMLKVATQFLAWAKDTRMGH